eukprot:1158812-Pelagomonas_calceolata.AAC.4
MAPTPAPLALKPFMGDALPAARAPLKRTPPPTAMAGGAVGGGEGCRLLLLLARGMVGRSCWERERVRAGEGLTALHVQTTKSVCICVRESELHCARKMQRSELHKGKGSVRQAALLDVAGVCG